jgi:O-antigen/teichoic acid export membrane protein
MADPVIRKIHFDSLRTVAIGPVKFIVPTVAYALIYPLIIARSSLDVVGIWAVFSSIAAFVNVTDIGFSQLLTREAGLDRLDQGDDVRGDYTAARRFYGLVLVLVVTVFLLLRRQFVSLTGGNYPAEELVLAMVILLTGTIVQLISKLDAALLSAWHENVTVQVTSGVSPLLMYSIAVAGAWFRRPVEGLALGTLASGIFSLVIFRVKIRRTVPGWKDRAVVLPVRESVTRIKGLVRRGLYLYGSSIGMLVRAPVYRLIVAGILGLQAVAVVDIAMRVTQVIRDAVASGFSVLYPSFSYLHRKREHDRIVRITQMSLLVLISAGVLSLGLMMAMVRPVLAAWLGSLPDGLESAVRILCIWQMITLLNVPFWYLLQAAKEERAAALSIWSHSLLVIMLIPLSKVVAFQLNSLLIYWTLTSIVTQMLIYFHVQKKLHALWDVTGSPQVLILLGLATLYTFSCYHIYYMSSGTSLLISTVIAGGLFAGLSLMAALRPLARFVRSGNILGG